MSLTHCECAVADACRQLNERLAPFKEKMPDASFREIVNAAYFERVDLSAHGFYKTPDVTGFGGALPFNYFTFGAACSEVELDTLTGLPSWVHIFVWAQTKMRKAVIARDHVSYVYEITFITDLRYMPAKYGRQAEDQ